MLALFRCVAEAVAAKGFRGLADMVPGGQYLLDVSADAVNRLKKNREREQIREEVGKAARANVEEAKAAAKQVAREVVAANPADRLALELYLSQIPSAVRRSLRRPDDHHGRTIPIGHPVDKPADLVALLPTQLPRFRAGYRLSGGSGWTLVEPLGYGGFGEVWMANHPLVPDLRAVKFCTDDGARQSLKHEGTLVARVMRECRGAHVVRLMDADLAAETPWLAYEYVAGGDLTGFILSWQKLASGERLRRALDAGRVLAEAAGRFHTLSPPIVHRDLKPANVLVGEDGTLKITDFGIGGIVAAKTLAAATGVTNSTPTLTGSYTPLYASPQQRRGERPDPRDDVHALGVIAYQMLTGHLDSSPDMRAHEHLAAAGASQQLIGVIRDCVDSERTKRPANGTELARRLGALAPPPAPTVQLRPAPPVPLAASPVRGVTPLSVSAPQEPHLLASGPVAILVAGKLRERPANDPAADWVRGVGVPKSVTPEPGKVYSLKLRPSAKDADLDELPRLAAFRSLVGVDLTGCGRLTSEGYRRLSGLVQLQEMVAAQSSIDDAGLAAVRGLTNLQHLDLSETATGDAGLNHLLGIIRLRRLSLRATQVSDKGLSQLKALRNLEVIDLGRTAVQAVGLSHIQPGKIREFYAAGSQLTADAMHYIGIMPNLEVLRLDGSRAADDNSISSLPRLRNLRQLTAGATDLGDAGLAHIGRVTALRHLEVSGCQRVTDTGLTALAALPSLDTLDIGGTRVTDAGLAALGRLSVLRRLCLAGCSSITDNAMSSLRRLTRLEELDLTRTRVTGRGLVELERALSNCEVRHDS